MLKLICVTWISFIITYLIPCCLTFTCMHDQIVQKRSTIVTRSLRFKDIVAEREKNHTQFEPLQVHFYLDNFDHALSPTVIHNIDLAVTNVRKYLSKTFQVYKRKSPFLLERQSCVQRWQAGPNRGKCSKFSGAMEVCSTLEVSYPIPNRFLDKLEIYDYEAEIPRHQIKAGSGLLNSNFITFITSDSSDACQGSDISAFGTYCRVDRETNEPLAGILNICPSYFESKIYPPQHYYNIFLHEMFHILGFSIHLFEKFLPCLKGAPCDVPKNVIDKDSYDVPRLMFPLVIENMQKHFSCNDSDYGGPLVLEVNDTDDGKKEDETNHLSSHWDPVLMYSSIMMPMFSEYDLLFVDNITLAVFASTGWYDVKFSQVEDFRFGKGGGCEFGVNSTCDNVFLCDPKSDEKLGCDIVHKSFGKCSALSPNRKCGVYQPYNKENCELQLENQYGLDFYALGYQKKCLVLYDENNDTNPSCVPVKCKSSDSYDILINMTWYECFSQEMINAENISVFCPEFSLFCTGDNSLSIGRQYCPAEDNFFISMTMSFKNPTFTNLYKSQDFRNLKVTTLKRFAEKIDMPVNYIVNSSLTVFKQIRLTFSICPPLKESANNLTKIVNRVQSFLDGDNFMHILGQTKMIVSATNIKIDPWHAIRFTDHEGFRTLLIFPAICAIFLVSTVVASLMRFLVFSRR